MRSWNWNPGVSIGELFFGAEWHPETFAFRFERLPPSCEEADWDTYRIEDEMARVSVKDGRIVSVECVASLELNDRELLGLSVSDANGLLPGPVILREVYEDGSELWECEELGLMAWVEDGVIASATLSAAHR